MVLAALRARTSTYVTVGVSGSSFTGQEPKYERGRKKGREGKREERGLVGREEIN